MRFAFLQEIEQYPEKQRIYLDESGLCHRLQRTHGYAVKGENFSDNLAAQLHKMNHSKIS